MHGGKSEPGQAVWTLWNDAQRETSPIKHLALNSLSDLIWLPVHSKHVG